MLISLLSELYASGVQVVLENDKLKVRSTRGKVSNELLEKIKKYKPELIKHLQSKSYSVEFDEINKAVSKAFYPLSSAQKRLFLLQQMDLNSTAYNMPYIIPLGSEVDKDKTEEAFRQLISRHESFRTNFEVVEEEPVQRIHEQVDFGIEEFTIEKSDESDIRHQFVQAFDLSKAPLLRVAIVNVNGEGSLLMIDMHHIISDGVSHSILEREFQRLYSGEELAPLNLQYKDYSEWQNSQKQKDKVKKQEEFWKNKFEVEIPVLDLPVDYARPVLHSQEGATVDFALSKAETQNIKLLAKENGLTLYMSVLSVFNILLSKLSGQEDVVIGMPIAGRNHSDLENIVGVFVNTLAIRNEVNGNNSVKEFVEKLKQSTLEAFENQDYQFEDLVEKISLSRDVGRNPIFDVMFNLQNQSDSRADLSGFEGNNYIHEQGISKFDLTLTAVDYGEQLLLSFEYCTRLFKAETIERFIRYFKQIVAQISINPEKELSEIEIISAEEKQQLLYSFNDTQVTYPSQKSISQVFDEQVKGFSKKIALQDKDKAYTYQDLDEESNKIANCLIKFGVVDNQLVGLLADRSSDMIIGILGILKTGGAYVPIDPAYPIERVNHLIQDSGVNIILSTEVIDLEYDFAGDIININDLEIKESSTDLSLKSIKSSNIAYVMYTSGSTGNPKGVVIEQKSVLRLVQNNQFFPFHSEQKILLTGAPVFDATTFEIWGALLNGGSLYIASNEVIINSELLGECIRKNSITSLWLTSSLFNQLIDQDESIFDTLDYLLVGGDVLSVKHINKIKSRNSKLVLINGYGPTENTTFSTTFNIDKEYESNIPIGKPISNSTAYIFDRSNKLQAVGVSGELLLGGDGLAREYLNNPELTREKFIENPYKEDERLYKTGDLARWLPDGNIEFLGRIDQQVKIRGFRIELGEIESVLQKHESIKESVVLAREENGEKYLCAYLVAKEDFNQEEIRIHLSESLPDYMIPSYFVQLEKLPLTSNGKVNRKALPSPEIKAGDDYVAPSNAIEEKLVEIWSEVLKIEKEELSTTANFFSIGGHSLKASVLIGRIHKETGVEFPLRDAFVYTSIQAQANLINTRDKKEFISIPKAKDQDYYPLSSAQKRLYLLQEMEPESTAYNMPYIISLGAEAEKQKIEEVFRQLISRHESFRTSFEIVGEEPVQCIHEKVEFEIEEFSIEQDEVQNQRHQFIQAFDLRKAPLLRVSKVNIKGESSLLMIDMHHIISDGVSQAILEQEFQRLYSGEELVPLSLQYKDYSEWQNSEEQQIKVKEQEDYWVRKFDDEIPVLNLPTDYVRSVMQSTEGATVSFALNKEETQNIKFLAKENDLTLYMTVLSVFNILLSKLSGQEDIIVGTPIAGRNHSDLENIVGMFVNTLAIRSEVKESNTLKEYIKKLKQSTLEVYENQDYQFEDLVEKVSVVRDASRNPLFDVMFDLINSDGLTRDLNEDILKGIIHTPGISKFDLTMTAVDYGEQLLISIEYCTKLFKAKTIERFISYIREIIIQLPEKINEKLSTLDVISAKEKNLLLHEFNKTQSVYTSNKTIHEIFEDQVERTPNNIAIIKGCECLTYEELNKKANQLACYCRSNGVSKESKIGLLTDHSLAMMIGMLGILKSGGCYVPIDSTYPEERINFIIEDAEIDILLFSDLKLSSTIEVGIHFDIENSSLYKETKTNLEHINNPSNLAYIIYTSGSTGKPKGVMVEHRNVVSYIYAFQKEFCLNSRDNVMQQASISFDTFVEEAYPILTIGGKLTILEKEEILNLDTLSRLIKSKTITVISCSPLLLNEINTFPQNLLCDVRLFISGGDELRYSYINNLIDFSNIYNTYGPTETTVCSLYYKCQKNNIDNIPIGSPVANDTVFILNKNLKLLPIGVAGELCIGGAGLSRGYLNNEELTNEKFIEHPYKSDARLYKTGDLARWLPDGNVEFLGRIDDQVKIRGFRIELGEVESALLKHANIQGCVVLARDENGDKYLCAYLVSKEEFSQEEIRTYLSASLPDYMIPSYIVGLDKIPLTTNGKVNRKALPSPEVKAGEDYVAPSNKLEEKLVQIWSEVLKIEKEDISVTANFFAIGGHSLKATVLTGRIHKETGVEFPLRDVFIHSSIKAQARQIEISIKKDFVTIPKAKAKDYYAQSSAQKRLYLLHQIDLSSTAYNMPYIIPLGAEAEKEKIEEAFRQLISRHESFRTSFEVLGEEPVQRIHEQVEFKIEEFTIEKVDEQKIRQQFIQPFDLSQAPLVRASKIDIKGEGSLLMIDMHHIISDGVSQTILEREFQSLHVGEGLAPLSLQYKDFSEWQNSEEQQRRVKDQESYWLNKFEGEIPVLDLPTDYVRPVIQSYEGASVGFVLSKEETQHIKSLAKENDLTLYMSILSVFNILLSKLSGQEDIIIGTPIAGRNHSDLENIVGMFINTLPMRNNVDGNETLKEFTKKLKLGTFNAYENQEYQFEELAENIIINRDVSRNPIFDVVCNLLNQTEYSGDISSLINQELIHTTGISKFDLTLAAVDYGDQLMLSFEYCTKLFKAETIERFINYFKLIVSQLTDKLNEKISTIEIITEEEKQQLLYEFNNTICDYPKDKTIQCFFEEQVRIKSDKIALTLDDEFLSYQELNDKANVIANNLRENGISRDDIVIIFLDRSFETVFSMLGILKSGGAYLPIDPDYPKERIDFILNDSQSKTIITNKDLSERIEFDGNIICVEEISISSHSFSNIESINKPSDLSYIIYTSGTTGKPKGVMIEHRNVVRLFFNDKFQFDFSDKDVWTMFHSHCFDFSVWEMYGALLYGGKLIIIPKIVARDAVEYYNVLSKEKVTVLNQTPSAFYNLAQVALSKPNKSLENLRYLIFGGEALKPNKLKEWFNIYSDVKLINMFGITETTVHVTYKEIGKNEIDNNISNIGTSIPTLTTYVVDKNLQLVPKGFSGELLIGGDGVSRGYLGREDLTSEKFINNPYKPEERLYRSGDLVKMLSNGEMEYLGRIDNQVQLRGFRIELGEIESVIQKHENIKEGVVVANEKNGEKYLCAYIVSENGLNQEEIRTYLSASLPDYMIPSYFVELEALPLTSNGKVNLKVLPSPEVKVGDDYVSPTNEIEEKLVEIWSEILKIEKIGIDNNYFSLGGDSITALRLISAINNRMNVNVGVSDLYANQTVRHFSKCISNSVSVSSESIKIISIKNDLEKNKNQILSGDSIKNKENVEDIYPACDIQVGMIYYSLIDPDVYHDQMVHIVEFSVMDTNLLDRALYLMMEKHSILRTGFYQDGNELKQVVFKKLDPEIKHYNISDKNTQEQNDFIREYLYNDKNVPFDIKEHLWRFFTFDLGNNAYCICFICHHAIIDGWSDASFNTELNNIYLALQKDPHFIPEQLQSSYKDFVIDQIYAAKNKELIDFWKDELIGYKRFAFDIVDKDALYKTKEEKLPDDVHTELISIAQQLNVSVKNICFSAFMYTLKMFSYDNDITVGLITNNRPTVEDGDKILGCFLNTVPFRTIIPENVTWKEYINSTNEKLNNLKRYDKISLLKIVELTGEVSTSQNPITDIIFNYVDFHIYDEIEENELRQTNNEGETNELQSNMGGVQSNSLFGFDISATGGNLFYSLSYITSFISEERVKDFFEFFRTILVSISKNPEKLINSNNIISHNVLQKLLYDFNDTKIDFSRDKAIHELFEEQVKRTPNACALVRGSNKLTYKEFNQETDKLSNILINKGIKCNDFVAIFADQSIEFLISIFAVLKAGGAYVPIDNNYPVSRKNYIIKDCDAKIILSTKSVRSANKETLMDIEDDRIVNVDELDNYESPVQYDPVKLKSDNLIYLIYTSGSTGNPKGAAVYHKGFANLMHWFINENTITSTDSVLLMSSTSFDLTQKNLFAALLCGGSLHLMPTSHYDPDIISDIISREKITWINCTPSAFYPIVEAKEDSLLEKLNSLRFVSLGGEPISMNKLSTWLSLESNKTKIVNTYGPTEATDICASFIIENPLDYLDKIIPIGKPICNVQIFILDINYRIVPIGISGELCISGAGLALGYLNNTALTSEKFIKHPFKEGERLYKTGDLARWLPDGKIEFLGRIDHQVKIRGFRIELGEIESLLQKHDQIKDCVVIDIEASGDKCLCAYLVTEEKFNKEEIRTYLSASLPDYMIPLYFVELDSLPLTSNGKVNRKALPSPEIKAGEDYVAPSNEIEENLVKIWSEVLNIEKEDISVTANFFAIGGHSLKATILIGRIHKEIGVEFPLRDVFLYSSIQAQAVQIELSTKKNFVSIPKVKEQDYYALSSAQKRLYLLQQMELDSTAYNIPYIIPLGAEVEKEKIEEAFQQLIKRHESFRTSFEIEGEEPVQRIHEHVEFKLEELTLAKDEVQEKRHQFIQAFDLSKAPLLRVSKVDIKGESSLLMIDMHHIISDGVSHAILEQDFQRLYSGEYLAPLSLQYKDYSQWQNSEEQQARVKKQENYWINKFEQEIPVLNLPIDKVRPAIQSHEGASVNFALSKEETQHIKSLAKENDLTLYLSVLSAFNILISKISGQEDIIVGTPIAGRNHSDLENIVGMFVNTLAIRNEVKGSNTLKEFIKKLKQTTLEAFENQDYQFEELVENISIERDISRNPLFDVMFSFQNQEADIRADLSGLENNKYEHKSGLSKFDLTLTAVDYGEQMMFSFEYCTKLFKAETIERYIGYFKQIVNQLTIKSERELSEIEIISTEEKQQLLYEFNNLNIDYPKDRTIHDLFEEQVVQTPDNIALVYGSESITYSELNRKSNQLARYLILNGVLEHDFVGLLHEYSLAVYIGILGILKTGKAYLPIDSTLPDSRIQFMIKECRIKILLTNNLRNQYHDEENKPIIPINISETPIDNARNLKLKISSTTPAYIIYTSGSTGKPKGVLIENKSLVNLCFNHNNFYGIKQSDRISKFAGFGFDASVWEIFPCLIAGSSLYIIDENIKLDSEEVNKYFEKKNITVSFLPTQLCEKFMEHDNKSLKILLTGGDKLNTFKQRDYKLYNNYGPTENTVVTTRFEVQSLENNIPIGKPIENSNIFILDKYDHIQPIGVSGELCISGDGLAKGYLNNPELTSEKFIDHPYKDGEQLYRTGDLARCLPDGNIEFLGRIDHQVKIRGFRIELGEIENVLLKHESINESVVLAREENADKYLCAYLVTEEEFKQKEIRTYLSASLPDYMIPSYFVQLEKLPLTSNGKVNRKALPSPEIKAGDDYVAPSNSTEEKLVEIWSEVLKIEKEEISTTANFFSIGGHSLKASVLTGKIHKEIGVEFPLRDVFIHSSIQAQAGQINTRDKKDFVSIPKAKEQDYYPLSSAQKRLYLLHQMDLASTAYNMPYVISIGAEEDKQKIEETFRQLISRHESFRTSFEIVGEEPVQRIHEQVDFKLEELTVTKEEVQEKRQHFIQAFDLSKAPLLRVIKVDIKGESSLLMIDMHHIISDGVSHSILEEDFRRLYSGGKLAPLSLQYKDYSQWQNSEEQQLKVKKQENYWISKFEEEIPVLNLPIDKVRPAIQSHEGASVSFALSKEVTQHIKSLANENELTLYMSVLSVFNILLSKLSGQEDIIVGTPIAGRNHSDLENIVGMFVNTLAIRNEVNGSNTLKEFLGKLKQSTLEAYENQDYQFEDLVDKV
ncbi:MAG: amino acid adenylation domain-containing protein, partial [Bacteroidales bacterium]|nr:amino acid adenylation domain-containing protein [Bacteroidales bacterium]